MKVGVKAGILLFSVAILLVTLQAESATSLGTVMPATFLFILLPLLGGRMKPPTSERDTDLSNLANGK